MTLGKADAAFEWLEEVSGERPLAWVRDQNDRSLKRLQALPGYAERQAEALAILQAKDKIAYGRIHGDFVYNLWQDATHVKGLWRRTPWAAFVAQQPAWEVLLDVDQLAKDHGKAFVFRGSDMLRPTYDRCLIELSDGGGDAAEHWEFDLQAKRFVDGGFRLAASKSRVTWLDRDRLLLADARAGVDTTDSGYPLQVKLWERGKAEPEDTAILTGKPSDMMVYASVYRDGDDAYPIIERATSFFTSVHFHYAQEKLTPLPLPDDTQIRGVHRGQLVFTNRTTFQGHAAGALLAVPFADLLKGKDTATLIFAPSATQAVDGVAFGCDYIYVSLLEDVRGVVLRFAKQGTQWLSKALPFEGSGTLSVHSCALRSHRLLVGYEDFLTPPSLWAVDGEQMTKQLVQRLPPRFAADELTISQAFVASDDGTRVPYFLVHRKDLVFNGQQPTLLYGYGGFEIALPPAYLTVAGKLWLEQGGVYALANIRGGGEYGPAWHRAALKENRQRCYEDFAAVAKDLMKRHITSPRHLGIQGGSNGGLLMGAMLTQHPELFHAVVCMVPLLDMLRYHKLLAGASWMAEYGDPDDPVQADYIRRYSPFQNLRAEASYPEVFYMTSTKDDRVHPGHARKMAARMADLKKPFLYFERIDGGHSASADLRQSAENQALIYSYLWDKLS